MCGRFVWWEFRRRERKNDTWDSEKERKTAESIKGGGRVGMGGWLNFSSDHVEPIKADHGTQPPPPTSSTFFVLSLFPPRVLAFIHPLSAPPLPTRTRESVLFLGCALFRLAPSRMSRNPSATPFVPRHRGFLLPSLASSSSCLLPRPLIHSLSGNSLDFFASRGGVIYLAEVERRPRRWSTKRAGVGSAVRGGYIAGE